MSTLGALPYKTWQYINYQNIFMEHSATCHHASVLSIPLVPQPPVKIEKPLGAEIRGHVMRKKMSHADLHRQAAYGREAEASAYLIIYHARICTFLSKKKHKRGRNALENMGNVC